jgi:hypothetical protein
MDKQLRSGHLDVRINEASAWVTVPTISKLRVALDQMEAAGVDVESPLTISHLANALGTFVISELQGQYSSDDSDSLIDLLQSYPKYRLLVVSTTETSVHRGRSITMTNVGAGRDDNGTPYLLGLNADEPEAVDVRFDDIKQIVFI